MREPLRQNFWSQLNNLALVRFLLLFASGWALVQLLAYFETVIIIFAFAAILAFVLSYPVRWLRRFLPHGIAVSFVFLLSLVSIGGLAVTVGLTLLSQAQQLVESVTVFLNSLLPLTEQLDEFLRNRDVYVDLNAIQQRFQERLLAGNSALITYVLFKIQIFFADFIYIILIVSITFFMLLNGQQLWIFIIKIVPPNLRYRFASIVKRKFLGFIKGQLILILFLTTSTFIVFLILHVPLPLILSTIIGVFDIVPVVGATLGVSIISLIVLSQSVWLALKVLGACIVLQQIQDNLIAPRVMRNSVNINPLVIFFALLVGARIAGILGIFLAIPITGVIVSFFEIEEMKAEL